MSGFLEGVRAVAEATRAHADELNRLDGYAGDGDLGVTMTSAAAAVLALLPDMDGKQPADVLSACSLAIAREAPSTAGTLVATGLLRAAAACRHDEGEFPPVSTLLAAAAEGIAERGRADVGSKTMLDALMPAAAAANEPAATTAAALAAAATAADAGAAATTTMTARFGRASWLAERSAGHEDAGARLVAIMLAAAAARAAGDRST
jgi:dihydroxyacetone kinase